MWMIFWIVSIVATMYIADQKKLSVAGYFLLSLLLGPLAVIIVMLTPAKNAPAHESSRSIDTLQDAKKQLQIIQFDLYALEERTKNLEKHIARLSGSPVEVASEGRVMPEPVLEKAAQPQIVPDQGPAETAKKSDMELDFGRNWLSKIGVVVLALGIAFLISYTFKYFGPFLKIVFGYVVAGALFYIGAKLEAKEKFINYGRVLLGGAWAIIYFTTYAMHHFDASRIIADQAVDLGLLALVVAGMMAHVLKYKSEGMMSVVLFVAYLTSTIGQITSFTFTSSLFLAFLVFFLVYKFQWVKTLAMAILLTYGIHLVWVMPNIMTSVPRPVLLGMATANYYDLMNFIFLTGYWALFFIGAHLARSISDPILVRALAAANFGNIALYSVLSYPLVLKLFYAERSSIVLAAGAVYLIAALVMKKLGRRKMYISDIVAAVFAITFAISLKFLPTSTLIMWMIEVPFLLFVGVNFKERIFRYFSYALAVVVALRLMFLSSFGFRPDVNFLGLVWTWYGFMCFWASISMAVCFYLTQRLNTDPENDVFDQAFDQIFSFAACSYLTLWVWSFIRQPWVALSLGLEGLAFLGISLVLGLRRFRAYAYLALILGTGAFLFETITASSAVLKWFIVSFDVLAVFAFYYAIKMLKQQKLIEQFFENEAELVFSAGILVLIVAIHQYVAPHWISLSLGFASVLIILTGFFNGDKTERMGGMALLALTLGRVVLVDLSGLDIIFKIVTLIVLGVLFLGVSYIYNRFSIGKK